MAQFEINLSEKKAEWVTKVYENLHEEETLRFYFQGMLTKNEKKYKNIIHIEIYYKLKFRKNSKIKKREFYENTYIGTIFTLPNNEKMFEDDDTIIVWFIAEVVSFKGTSFIVNLPDSYSVIYDEARKGSKL